MKNQYKDFHCNELVLLQAVSSHLNDSILNNLKENLSWITPIEYTYTNTSFNSSTLSGKTYLLNLLLNNDMVDLAEKLITPNAIEQIIKKLSTPSEGSNIWEHCIDFNNQEGLEFLLRHKIAPSNLNVLEHTINNIASFDSKISAEQLFKNFESLCQIAEESYNTSALKSYHDQKKSKNPITWKNLFFNNQLSGTSLQNIVNEGVQNSEGEFLLEFIKHYPITIRTSDLASLAERKKIIPALKLAEASNGGLTLRYFKDALELLTLASKSLSVDTFNTKEIKTIDYDDKVNTKKQYENNYFEIKEEFLKFYKNAQDFKDNLGNGLHLEKNLIYKNKELKDLLYGLACCYKDKPFIKDLNIMFKETPSCACLVNILQTIQAKKMVTYLPWLVKNNPNEINKFFGLVFGCDQFYNLLNPNYLGQAIGITDDIKKEGKWAKECEKILTEFKIQYPQFTFSSPDTLSFFKDYMSDLGHELNKHTLNEVRSCLEEAYFKNSQQQTRSSIKSIL